MSGIALTNFEDIKNNLTNDKPDIENGIIKPTSLILFQDLLKENDELNIHADGIISDIDDIVSNKDSINKNIAFRSIINTLKLSVKEYIYQKLLFERYVNNYEEIFNEENIVKVLNLIRLVISDRREILNGITENLLKLQRLDNDRIKIDAATGEDTDDIDNMVSPDTL